MDRSYNGPPRQGPVRHISPAQLNLERLYEQNRLNAQKKDAATAPGPAPGPATATGVATFCILERFYFAST